MKRQLSSNVSNDFIDKAFSSAMRAGALGGKLSGAGNGGFLNFVIEDCNFEKVKSELEKLKLIYFPIEPDFSGSTFTEL